MKRLGLVVNPYAGLGGRVGLKGTDGPETVRKALALGARPVAPQRAVLFLKALGRVGLELYTYPGPMGEEEALEAGWTPRVVGRLTRQETSAEDTRRAARLMAGLPVDLLVVVGGDGTARDVLDAIGQRLPVVGVPSGVKTYSSVYATSPRAAAELAHRYLKEGLPLGEGEVLDVDEAAFRAGRLEVRLYGYLKVPQEPRLLQASKEASPLGPEEEENRAAIARWLAERLEPSALYIVGPGNTPKALPRLLGLPFTLLGVDLYEGMRRVVALDVGEAAILQALSQYPKAKIVVTPIGGQGFILGRGNLQISPEVVRLAGREALIIVATRWKMAGLKALRVDTGDPMVDRSLQGYWRVLVDYGEEVVVRCL